MRLVRNIGAGALAGAIGTGAMDLLLFERYRRGGGEHTLRRWEFAEDVTRDARTLADERGVR
jgi:hypothetical protein